MNNDKYLISILITNYNKDNFLKKSINSCLNQSYKKKEIILFDDLSSDNSHNILKKYKKKNLSIIYNKRKKFNSGPLNQLYGIKKTFKLSKGKIIFLLDSDDFFLKNKINFITNKFINYKGLQFIQDIPYMSKQKKIFELKKKNHLVSIWPSFYPTSSIAVERNFFNDFLRLSKSNEFPNLEIDARLSIYAFLKKKFVTSNKSLTVYNYDQFGITSKYFKFSKNWWLKRNEAYNYMIFLMKKMKIKFIPSFDFYFTKLINFFILLK